MLELNKVYLGSCLDISKTISSNFIDMIITSPPYDYEMKVRKYDNNGWDIDVFKMLSVEMFRILKPGGVVVWIVNDTTKNGSESGYSFRQALHFIDIGFNLWDTMIYAKNNPFPLTHNRYEQQFEYMFILSKGKPKTFNPLMRQNKNAGKERSGGRFRQTGDTLLPKHTPGIINKESYKYNIWFYNVGYNQTSKDKQSFKHPASFPEQLIEDHIYSWTNENDIIFDPLAGSGTTGVVAKKLNRNYILCDISEDYVKLMEDRLKNDL